LYSNVKVSFFTVFFQLELSIEDILGINTVFSVILARYALLFLIFLGQFDFVPCLIHSKKKCILRDFSFFFYHVYVSKNVKCMDAANNESKLLFFVGFFFNKHNNALKMLRSIVSIGRKQFLKTSRSFSTAVSRNNNKNRSNKKSTQNILLALKNDSRVFTNTYKVSLIVIVIFKYFFFNL